MQFVNHIPSEIEDSLYAFSDWFFQQDLSKVRLSNPHDIDASYATSKEYLFERQKIQDQNKVGYPEKAFGADFLDLNCFDTNVFIKNIDELDSTLKAFVAAKRAAIKMYYPPGGFIDWHNNANAFGYNILFTYSETGQGSFLYQHPLSKEVVEMKDKKGWSAKVGCFDMNTGNPLWHAARTECNRLNWAYVVPETLWVDLVEELGVDPSFINSIFGTSPQLMQAQKTTRFID